MERLTTDQPLGNVKNALNLFYVKDGEVWVRGGGPEPLYQDVRLFDYIRQVLKATGDEDIAGIAEFSDEDLGEVMLDWLAEGNTTIEGLIGTLYTTAWAFAEIRERLKAYEDTGLNPEEVQTLAVAKEEGRLVVLPWAIGQTIYEADPDHGVVKHTLSGAVYAMRSTAVDDSGKTWPDYWHAEDESLAHMTREEAEAALKGEDHETDSV